MRNAAPGLNKLVAGSQKVAAGAAGLNGSAPGLTSAVIQAASGAASLDAGAHQLGAGANDLHTGATRLARGEADAVTGTGQLRTGMHQLSGSLVTLANGASDLGTSLRGGTERLPDLNDTTRAATADTIADPVRIKNIAEATAHSYGAGLAPFFMSLAAWIGGYVLFLFLRPLSTRAMAANQSPLRVAVGGWLTPAWLGTAQMVMLFLFVVGVLRFDPAHPVGTLALMVLVSVTFIAIVHTLNAWMGTIGQFLGLVLMVLQLVSAGGTFPWQTLPAPLHVLHVLLPMGYAVDALRHLIYGGDLGTVHLDIWVLAGYLIAAIGLTALAARRMRIWTPSRIQPEIVL
jgi:putative membrane protein